MKKILALLLILPLTINAIIVRNNSTSPTSEDSLSIIFYSLDSLGNSTTADSVFVLVVNPNGIISCKDSLIISDSRVTSTSIRSKQFYSFKEQVSNLDGDGLVGQYFLSILAYNSNLELLTPNQYDFQIISSKFSQQLDATDDSVIVKGGVIDSSMIASSIWNAPQSNHTSISTFGKYLDTEISGISSGSGIYSVSIFAYDSSANQVIPGVGFAIRNLDQSALLALGTGENNGEVTFNLNADSLILIPSLYGYIFDAYDTMVVTGAMADTVFGYKFIPGTSGNPYLTRVYGFLYDINGVAEVGEEVTVSLIGDGVRYNSVILTPTQISTVTDTVGYFYFDIIPSDSLQPEGSKYEFTINKKDGSIFRKRVQVPSQALWLLDW